MPRIVGVALALVIAVGTAVDAAAASARAGGHVRRSAGTRLLGVARIEPFAVNSPSGRIRAFPMRGDASGAGAQLLVYVVGRSRGTAVVAALYADRAGRPGRRLASARLASPRGGRWNRIGPMATAVHVRRRYWLAVGATGGRLVLRAGRRSCRVASAVPRTSIWAHVQWRLDRVARCPISAFLRGVRGALPSPSGVSPGSPGATASPPGSAPGPGAVPRRPSPVPAPAPLPGAPVLRPCTTTVTSMPALSRAVGAAAGGAVICVAPGSYTGLRVGGVHSADVTVQPEPSLDPTAAGNVTIGLSSVVTDGFGNPVAADVAPGSSHIVIRDLYFANELSIGYGSSAITVDHDDFSQVGNGGGEMINFATSNCLAANAPRWTGCSPLAPVSDVTISGNYFHGISSGGDDVLHTNNFRNLVVTGNEITGAVENNAGGHVDCLQNVFGGSGLIFSYNYEHDNECQGLFLKDGDVTNVSVEENLFVRDDVPATNGGSSYSSSQVWDTGGLVVENNTIWDDKGMTLRCIGAAVPCTATIDHNLVWVLDSGNLGDASRFTMTEGDDIVASGDVFNSTDRVQPHPAFMCGSICGNGSIPGDDYRLVNSGGIGITWAPSEVSYGPAR